MGRRRRPAALRIGVVLVAGLGCAVALVAAPSPAGAGVLPVDPKGSFVVTMRGSGHGHGMSQYGANAAAAAGKSYRQIVAFYYPGTSLRALPPKTMVRVRLSGTGPTTTVAPYSDLTVTGRAGTLPTAGIRRYRLVADAASGLTLQSLKTAEGSAWTVVKGGLPDGAEFHRTGWGTIRLYQSGGMSTDYRGYLRALRVGAKGTSGGVLTIDRLTIDRYTAGVVPREMPSGWRRAAVDAQAIAARTYGRYAVEHPLSLDYDICDTTQCQVYGGRVRYDASGGRLWSDFLPAAADTADKVLTYRGATIFAQFGASNGGWSVDGGQPYLRAAADPYDPAPGNPYIDYSQVVRAASVAARFHLASVTKIEITKRDGHGAWGGRMLAGVVDGKDKAGNTQRIAVTGFDLASAFGVNTTWFTLHSH